MATRRERVVLELVDQFSGPITRAAVATRAYREELDKLDRTTKRVDKRSEQASKSADKYSESLTQLNRRLQEVNTSSSQMQNSGIFSQSSGNALRNNGRELDRFSGRLRLIRDGILTLGPGLIPVGAVSIQALSGLASQLGFAAGAAGAAILAFQGVGDAVTAMNEYAVDPSTKNLEKLGEVLSSLGPDAAEFATQISNMRGQFRDLRDAAAAGFLPGLTDELARADVALGRLESILYALADAGGSVVADGLASFSTDRWADFADFLVMEARPALTDLGDSLGNFTHGLASMWQAMTPVNRDFSDWLLDISKRFDEWSQQLATSQGLAEFVDYVRETGPQVAETFGDLGDAMLQVVQAASPLGGPVLKILEKFAEVIAKIADSDIGTPLIAAAAAMALLNRGMTMMNRIGGGSGGGAGGGAVTGMSGLMAISNGATTASGRLRALGGDVRSMRGEFGHLNPPMAVAASALSNTSGAAHRVNSALRQTATVTGKAAAGVGALALVSTGAGESLGLQNTALLGLMGSMFGLPGAAVGVAAGALLDFKAAGDASEAAIRRLNMTLEQADASAPAKAFEIYAQGIRDIRTERDALEARYDNPFSPAVVGGLVQSLFTGENELQNAKRELAGIEIELTNGEYALREFGARAAEQAGLWDWTDMQPANLEEIQAGLTAVTPAMAALGLTTEDLIAAQQAGTEVDLARRLLAWDDAANRATYALASLTQGLQDLNSQLEGRAAARDYEEALDAISASIEENGRSLDISTAAGRANSEALDNIAVSGLAVAETLSGMERVRFLQRTRDDLIAMAGEFGMSGDEAARFADRLGLSADLITSAISASAAEARALYDAFGALPTTVQTDIRTNGFPQTDAEVRALQARYDLTPEQVQTVLRARDELSPVLARAQARINGITRNITVTVTGVMKGISAGFGLSAMGNIYPSGHPLVRAYADGGLDVANAHQPEITRPGSALRIWSEPETEGEGYIPLANDHRRPRAKSIIDHIVGRFGGRPVEWYDAGGVRGAVTGFKPDFGQNRFMDPRMSALRADINEWRHALRDAGMALNASQVRAAGAMQTTASRLFTLQDSIDALKSAQDSLVTSTVGNFRNDLFGNGAAGVKLQLEADINDGRTAQAAQSKLAGLGVNKGLLSELYASGDINTMQQLAQMSRHQIAQYNQLYATRQSVSANVGNTAGQQVYGQMLAQRNKLDAQLQRELGRLQKYMTDGVYAGFLAAQRAASTGVAARRRG